jgi:hypothetical protein
MRRLVFVVTLALVAVAAFAPSPRAEEPELRPVAWIPLVQIGLPPLEQELLNCNVGFEDGGNCWRDVQGAYPQIECEGGPGKLEAAGGAYRGRCHLWQGGYLDAFDVFESLPILVPDWASRLTVSLAWNISSDEDQDSLHDYDTWSLWLYVQDGSAGWELFSKGNTDETPWWKTWRRSTYVIADVEEHRGQRVFLQFVATGDADSATSFKADEVEVWGYSR